MMRAALHDIDPGDGDPGDLDAYALTGDAWHISQAPAAIPRLPGDGNPRIQAAEMDKIRATLAKNQLAADVEAVRAHFWMGAPVAVRMVAMMAAKMPKARANEPLKNLDAFERGTAYIAVEDLIAALTVLQKCLQGGTIPQAQEKRDLH
jgi:hypothetical protein